MTNLRVFRASRIVLLGSLIAACSNTPLPHPDGRTGPGDARLPGPGTHDANMYPGTDGGLPDAGGGSGTPDAASPDASTPTPDAL